MEAQEVPTAERLPRIIYSEKVQSAECPYEVSVDPVGTGELLLAAGVKEGDISRITIQVERKPTSMRARLMKSLHRNFEGVGLYDDKARTMFIYADPIWNSGEKMMKKAEHVSGNPDAYPKDKNLFPELWSGKRLSAYLRLAPKERALNTSRRLIDISIQRQMNTAIVHESSHAADFSTGKYKGTFKDLGGLRLIRNAAAQMAAVVAAGYGASYLANEVGVADLSMPLHIIATAGTIGFFLRWNTRGNYANSETEKRAYDFQKKNWRRHKLISMVPKAGRGD